MFRVLSVLIMLALNLGPSLARDETGEATTYSCNAKDAVSVMRDGTLSKLIGEAMIKRFEKMVIDVSNGHITYSDTATTEDWIVEETGMNDKDYIMYPPAARQFRRTVANAATHFIRLRAAPNEPQPRFIVVTLSFFVSGTCSLMPPLFPK